MKNITVDDKIAKATVLFKELLDNNCLDYILQQIPNDIKTMERLAFRLKESADHYHLSVINDEQIDEVINLVGLSQNLEVPFDEDEEMLEIFRSVKQSLSDLNGEVSGIKEMLQTLLEANGLL